MEKILPMQMYVAAIRPYGRANRRHTGDEQGGAKMNYINKIAKTLGLEPGEYFKIAGTDGEFWLDDNGLHMQDDKGDYDLNALLAALLTGRSKIVYPPWKPKFGDVYYHNNRFGGLLRERAEDNNLFDLMITKLGKAYRTEAEARSHAEEDAAFWESIREELLK